MSATPGYRGRVSVEGTILRATRWSVSPKVQETDVSTVAEVGGRLFVGDLPRYDLSFDAFWDHNDNPFNGQPPGIKAGATSPNVQFFLRKAGVPQTRPFWSFPSVLWLSVEQEAGVRNVVRYSVNGVASGGTTLPEYPGALSATLPVGVPEAPTPPTVSWLTDSLNVTGTAGSTSLGTVSLVIVLSEVSSVDVTVSVTTLPGTAATRNYSQVIEFPVTIPAGQTQVTFTLFSVTFPTLLQGSLYFTILLSDPVNAILSPPDTATVVLTPT